MAKGSSEPGRLPAELEAAEARLRMLLREAHGMIKDLRQATAAARAQQGEIETAVNGGLTWISDEMRRFLREQEKIVHAGMEAAAEGAVAGINAGAQKVTDHFMAVLGCEQPGDMLQQIVDAAGKDIAKQIAVITVEQMRQDRDAGG